MNDEARDDDLLERKANLLRSRLTRTIDVLDQRRHEMTNPSVLLTRYRGPLMMAGAAAIGLTALGLGVAALRGRARAKRINRERWRLLGHLWRHPEEITARPSLPSELLRRIVVGALSFAALHLVRRGLAATLPEPRA
jgi:hypothetical protein